MIQLAHCGDSYPALAARVRDERSTARCREPASSQRRCGDDTDDRDAIFHECDQRGPDGDAAQKVLGAIDRVDDPLASVGCISCPELLTDDRILRSCGRKRGPKSLLGGTIGICHRCCIGLGLDVKVKGLETCAGERIGAVGQCERELEVGG